jgi:hypothetical protein
LTSGGWQHKIYQDELNDGSGSFFNLNRSMNNRPRNPRKLVHKGSYQKNSKGYDNNKLLENQVYFAITGTAPVPVLLQRPLMHSNSARFSQTIIHSALCKALDKKLPDASVN